MRGDVDIPKPSAKQMEKILRHLNYQILCVDTSIVCSSGPNLFLEMNQTEICVEFLYKNYKPKVFDIVN